MVNDRSLHFKVDEFNEFVACSTGLGNGDVNDRDATEFVDDAVREPLCDSAVLCTLPLVGFVGLSGSGTDAEGWPSYSECR